ncbi:ThuA domain-containing protein [Alicyclobacillus shizuokensis]|uniref:ThuA domain-containing protein n=1 Tax=Alicyclobacillus shizuokensis TaxID=392014 RepID=UPI0008294EB1|nr:ThuA domain-containing protein [Alicyclobacillus shizuokensis]
MPKNVLAVIGDFYHPSTPINTALDHAFGPLREGGYTLQVIAETQLPDGLLSRPDLIVLYKENRTNPSVDENETWLTPEIEDQIVHYVETGGAWLAWHAGLASYPAPGPYTDMLRGHFKWHPEKNKMVRYSMGHHPIVENMTPFEIMDEQYFVACDEAKTQVYLWSESPDGRSPAGWAHPFGTGRVCCLAPAHRPEGLMHPAMRSLLSQALLWCTKRM